jgi:hypothetical protein
MMDWMTAVEGQFLMSEQEQRVQTRAAWLAAALVSAVYFVGRQEVDGVGVPELKGRVAKSSRRAVDLAFSYPVPQLGS